MVALLVTGRSQRARTASAVASHWAAMLVALGPSFAHAAPRGPDSPPPELAAIEAERSPKETSQGAPALRDSGRPTEGVPGAEDRLRELVKTGVTAYRNGRYEEAWEALNAAWGLKRSVVIASVIADVEMKLGRYDKAAYHWAYAKRHLPSDASEAMHEIAEGLKECAQHTAIVVPMIEPEGAEFLLDNLVVDLRDSDARAWTMPGSHTISARVAGRSASPQTITVDAGQVYSVRISIPPESNPVPHSAEAPRPSDRAASHPAARAEGSASRVLVTIVGGGLALIAAGTAVAFTLHRDSLGKKIDDLRAALGRQGSQLPNSAPCDPTVAHPPAQCGELPTNIRDYNRATDEANLFLGVSAGLAVATIATYAFWPSGRDPRAHGARSVPLILAPWCSYRSQGLNLQGRF